MGKLSALKVSKVKGKGLYPDGNGLYLQVGPSGAKSWIYRYRIPGGRRAMGLGPISDVGLAEARELAADARKLLRRGVDPIEERKRASDVTRVAANAKTFKICAEEFLQINEPAWQNAKHRQQWRNTLASYVYPKIGEIEVREVNPSTIADILQPLYLAKRETAKRVRGRIEAVLGYAIAKGYRHGPNPALWRGNIENLVNRPPRVPARHFSALPYANVPDFIAALKGQEGIAARALELAILTASRTGEVIHARWVEIDLDKRVWTVPAERMKMRREHRVPLSSAAVAIIKKMLPTRATDDGYVFPGSFRDEPLSNMAMLMTVRRMDYATTVHGFRSSFRDWAADETQYHKDVAEAALAHTIKDRSEAAYRRSDLFEKRRALMEDWATYCLKGRAVADSGHVTGSRSAA